MLVSPSSTSIILLLSFSHTLHRPRCQIRRRLHGVRSLSAGSTPTSPPSSDLVIFGSPSPIIEEDEIDDDGSGRSGSPLAAQLSVCGVRRRMEEDEIDDDRSGGNELDDESGGSDSLGEMGSEFVSTTPELREMRESVDTEGVVDTPSPEFGKQHRNGS